MNLALIVMEEERFREIISEEVQKAMQGLQVNTVEDKVLNVKEASEYLGVCEDKVRDMTNRPGFPSARDGNRILIPLADLRIWLSEQARANTGKPSGNATTHRRYG